MGKSVSEQLLAYLQTNPGVHASGTLQRLEWRNHTGSLAVPRSVVRRLQELAEEGKIHCEMKGNHAHYSATPIEKKPERKLVYDPVRDVMVWTSAT